MEGGLGMQEARKEGGRHLRKDQASPRRTLSKNRGHASGTNERKTPRELIAPSPHRFVFLLEMWVYDIARQACCGAGAALPSARRVNSASNLPGQSCYICEYQSHAPVFRNNFSPADYCGGTTLWLPRRRGGRRPRSAESGPRHVARQVRKLSGAVFTRRQWAGEVLIIPTTCWAAGFAWCKSGPRALPDSVGRRSLRF